MKAKKKVVERPEATERVLKERRGGRDTKAARLQIALPSLKASGKCLVQTNSLSEQMGNTRELGI